MPAILITLVIILTLSGFNNTSENQQNNQPTQESYVQNEVKITSEYNEKRLRVYE